MKMFLLKFRINPYLLLFIVLIVGLQISALHPDIIEKYYTKGFYEGYSALLYRITGIVPFSVGDLAYAVVILLLGRALYRTYRVAKTWQAKSVRIIGFLLKTIVCFLVYFNLSWGLNNYRQPLTKQLGIEGSYTQAEVLALTKRLIAETNTQLMAITKDSLKAVEVIQSRDQILSDTQYGIQQLNEELQLFTYKPNRIKHSLFSLPLTYMGFSGYLNPFTLEAQVNSMIPKTTMIVTASHEAIHQYGYALESDANFLGYMAAAKQKDVQYQYGAAIYALRYCLNAIDYNENEPMLIDELLDTIYPGVQANIMENTVFWQAYKTSTDSFFKAFYGAFLKANNQKDGLKSYNRFVDLLINYDRNKQDT